MEDYPRTLAEFETRFSTEDACRRYLYQLRWPEGFICPHCAGSNAWMTERDLVVCAACSYHASYLDEFTFRFNRRTCGSRGKLFYRMVQQAAHVDAVPYQAIVKHVRNRRNANHKL